MLLFLVLFELWLLQFRYFRFGFGFGRFLAKNRGISFSRFRFSIQKMSITLHIAFFENDQTYYFVWNQMYNTVMFVYKLAVYVMQLLHIKIQMTFRVGLYSD